MFALVLLGSRMQALEVSDQPIRGDNWAKKFRETQSPEMSCAADVSSD